MTALLSRRGRRYVPPPPAPSIWRIREPYGPDPIAIGDLSRERTLTAGYADGERHCRHHPGVTWRGDQPCFVCVPPSAS